MRIALPLLLSLACLGLGGCGQKGPLFIPNDDSAPTPSAQPAPAPAPVQPTPLPETPTAQ
jgi:predicted small lipoprotein YifL